MSETANERIKMVNGCEIFSLNYEGTVYIKKNEVYLDGEIIDTLNTEKKVSNLWEDYLQAESLY